MCLVLGLSVVRGGEGVGFSRPLVMSMLRQTIRLTAFARKAPISRTPSRRFCSTKGGEDIDKGWTFGGVTKLVLAFGICCGLTDWVFYGDTSFHKKNNKLHVEVLKERMLILDLEKQMHDLRLQAEMK
ncbi:megakaryoblastic leukemia 1 protein [Striga asiatica]|uniref:Megakaryoblastic leukemia 1 protein n=1 Tax=Striga asiatica TaxID=4170 RepID=A0A5A7PFU1_STRAF|nr:megakaryoblastic leukemia 1 protein [Striga asiatica]